MHDHEDPTTLWTLRREERELVCQVRLVRYGIEVDLLQDGALSVTRSFDDGEAALAWARARRATCEAEGWCAPAGPSGADVPVRPRRSD